MTRKSRLRQPSRPARHSRRPPLRLTPYAWAKLLHLRDLGRTEVGGFGVSSPDNLLLVEDVQLVQQQCTPVTVKFDDSSVADYFDAQVDQGRLPEQFGRIWVHTHPGNSPHPSCTDEDTFERCFGSADWALMFIVARGGQTYARLRFNAGPCGDLVLPVEIDFAEPFPAADPAAWDAEFRQMVTVEPDRPREPQLAKLAQDRMGWPEDHSPRFGDAWYDSIPQDIYSDLPWELFDDAFR